MPFINMMGYVNRLCLLLFAVASAGAIDIPLNRGGTEISEFSAPVLNKVLVTYLLAGSDVTDRQLIIPIPASNDLQQIQNIRIAGFSVDSFATDEVGNLLLITKPIVSNTEFILLEFTILTIQASFWTPEEYYYNTSIKRSLFPAVFAASPPEHIYSSTQIVRLINQFKNQVNKTAPEIINKLYDPLISSFYPHTKEQLTKPLLYLASAIRNAGAGIRLIHGISMPEKVPSLTKNYYIEIIIPGFGIIFLNPYLEPFVNDSNFIELFTSTVDDKLQFGLGIYSNGQYQAVQSTAFVQAGIGQNEDNEFHNDILGRYLTFENTDGETIRELTQVRNDIRDIIPIYKLETTDRSYIRPAIRSKVSTVQLSPALDDNNDPINPREEYQNGEKVHALIYFSDRFTEKNVFVRWIKPSGDVYYISNDIINAAWSKVYYTCEIKPEMERGQWIFEVSINGNLEYRKEFSVY